MEGDAIIRLRQLLLKARYSFWFLPALNVLAAVVLAVVLIEADGWFPPGAFEQWPRLFGAGADGARGLLTAVASSMITVAGVVFSITLVALSLASSQYTSRVLRNFLSDRVTQSVLGAFVGIFAYCLVVLRTIRGGDEGQFVPSVAVLVGLLLGFVGIGVLIYFIHHISTSIQASHILAAAARETLRAVDNLFPEGVGDEGADGVREAAGVGGTWHPVAAVRTGYVQGLDTRGLLAFAGERRTVVRMERRVGQFVIEGEPLAAVLGVAPSDDLRRLRGLYAIGRQRTVEQDAAFGIRQIVDVALKALSPGVNDTTTAVMCIDHLTAILVRLSDRRIESCYRSQDGELRLLTCGPTYADLVGEAFDQIRQNAGGNVAVLEGVLGSLGLLAGRTKAPWRREVLLEHARAVAELSRQSLSASLDVRRVADVSARTLELLGADATAEPEAAPDTGRV
ncbi:MAG TPA: DUF2254 domain-containing protein [Fimbriiglobus sp.]|nr:DUF2254 domain-containing protein [Fimbriiglobus sp.]